MLYGGDMMGFMVDMGIISNVGKLGGCEASLEVIITLEFEVKMKDAEIASFIKKSDLVSGGEKWGSTRKAQATLFVSHGMLMGE